MEIEELPDLKIGWDKAYEYQDVPLLDYVWEVANKFLPSVEDTDIGMMPAESIAPAIFANRYFEKNLTIEERYERAKEMGTFKATLEKYKETNADYRKLDDSFKKKFLENEDLQNTIEAFGLDVSKFWYLLLFVYDFIEDIGTNAPTMDKSLLEDFAYFFVNLCDSTSITLKKGNKKSYSTEREGLIDILQIAIFHFYEKYCNIVKGEQDRETKVKQLKEIGLKGFIDNSLLSQMNFKEKSNLDISYKKWKFTEMFQFFLENRKAVTIPNKKVKVSKDKMMFISRLIYTVGYHGKEYNAEYDEDGNKNRMLSNLLRRYGKEKFPPIIANNYMVY